MIFNSKFLESANLGKNNWWRFALSIVMILAFYLLGTFLAGLVGIYLNNGTRPKGAMSEFIIDHSNIFVSKIVLNLEFIVGFIGLFLAVKFIHKRNFITLVTSLSKINWKIIFSGSIVYFIFYLIVEIIYSYYNKNSFQFALHTDNFLPLALISFLMVPIQTSFEELFHRGYFLQMLSYYLRYPWISLLITSVLFGIVHVKHPEYLIFYCGIGLFLGLITIVSNSLEISIGIHAVANLFGLFISETFDGLSLFYHNKNPTNVFIWLIPIILIFLLVLNKYGSSNLKLMFVKTSREKE